MLQEKNLEIIATLPEMDEWPPVTKGVFSAPGFEVGKGMRRAQPIHFGASFSEPDPSEVVKVIEKLEGVLRNLYWHSARAHLVTEIYGTYDFLWNSEVIYTDVDTEPPSTSRWKRQVLSEGKAIDLNDLLQ